ncbi:DUF2515 domain-containing protein [Paenibacillus oenotherae]|uniref:DUF2515 domain-containing protein n=1 Tax=Paenibacillus oenotherae TaxID=1435645 RepID=A0ABS7D2I9_9BACL|nr:DUF2515 family protein [Paenibacillus oenotherae]MBW7474142.1 DUF2515 domain-containing protein [Paenibacillus oenotherae]
MNEENNSKGSTLKRVLAIISRIPAFIKDIVAAKLRARAASETLAMDSRPFMLSAERVRELAVEWGEERREHTTSASTEEWSEEERRLIERIREETVQANRNNVTRTEAYRSIYFRKPELHWAMLAHLVSRNGGWNMTDLKGDLLPHLLSLKQRQNIFELLERANALIFQDAYPQLLLYEAGRREGKLLTHLLPAFGVSRFMGPVWKQFWRYNDSALLTTALIINEQHYIEKRIVQHPHYRNHVLNKSSFHIQIPLQTNAVIMPYRSRQSGGLKLAGLVIENFSSLEERIEFGKRLYMILFGVQPVHEGVLNFVRAVPHSGSRADYAPHLFTKAKPQGNDSLYKERLIECCLKAGAAPLRSPCLSDAWEDHAIEPAGSADWFDGENEVCHYLKELPLPRIFEITDEHCLGLNKIELAVIAAQKAGMKPISE